MDKESIYINPCLWAVNCSSRAWSKLQCACAVRVLPEVHLRTCSTAFDNLEKTTKQLAGSLWFTTNRSSDACNKTSVSVEPFLSISWCNYPQTTPQLETVSLLFRFSGDSVSSQTQLTLACIRLLVTLHA